MLEPLTDLCTPWCVRVVATLHIAEHLDRGVTDLDALANAAHCDPDYLGRVLRHLVPKNVFSEPTPNRFALSAAGRELLDPACQVGLDLEGIGGRMALAWGTLLKAVRSGEPAYADLFGRPFWDDLDAHPELARSFEGLMGPAGHGLPDPHVLLDDDWDEVGTVVDVGGSLGTLLIEILRRRPEVRGVLVELPNTAERARMGFLDAGLADRADIVGQSFFDPLPGGDLYVLSKIVSNWGDRDTVRILRRCAEAMRPGGRVVVLGGISPSTTPPAISIETVLVGGKTDPLGTFERLAEEAGLRVHKAASQSSGRFVVECREP